MENDDAPIGTILTRRAALALTARIGIGAGLASLLSRRLWADVAATQPALPLVASPSLTEGPFFVDEKLNRSDLTTGTNRESVVKGLPLYLGFKVFKLADKVLTPIKDIQVDVWHCDAAGAYSDEANPMNHDDTSKQTWLRGYQMSDGQGKVNFKTILPGWYPGRTPHIHFKIRQTRDAKTSGGKPIVADFTSQVFFHDEDLDRLLANAPYNSRGKRRGRNRDDGIYSEPLTDGSVAGVALTLELKKSEKGDGIAATFPVVLTDENLAPHERGRGPRGGPPGGRGGPGRPGGRPPGPPPDFDGPPR